MLKNALLEVVVYAVKAEKQEQFSVSVDRAESILRAKTTGLRWWSHWESADRVYRADVLCWASPEEALAAAKMMSTDEDLRFFTSAITEVKLMGHYRAAAEPGELMEALSTENHLLELALFTSSDPVASSSLHPTLHELLSQRPGCLCHYALNHHSEPAGFGDLAIWQSVEDHQAAGKELMGLPELGPYFGNISELSVYSLFTLAKPIATAKATN